MPAVRAAISRLVLLILFLLPAAAAADPPAAARFDEESGIVHVAADVPSVYEIRQGGKTVLSGVVPAGTDEVEAGRSLRRGEFELLLFPLAYRRALDAGRQGTGLGDLLRPRGVALDPARRAVVVDSGNDRVQVFNPSLLPEFEFGGFNWRERDVSFNRLSDSTRGSFNAPFDVACTIRDIYVTDRDNHRVQKFDRDGNFLLSFGGSGGGRGRFTFPAGIAADRMGNIYVVDGRNDRVQKFDGNGNFVLEIGGFGAGEGRFNGPRDVALDAALRIHVLDHGNRRVQVFDRHGHLRGGFALPAEGDYDSLAVVLEETLAVTDAKGGRLLLFAREGETVLELAGLDRPAGVAADPEGNLLVVESGIARIVRFERERDRDRFRLAAP